MLWTYRLRTLTTKFWLVVVAMYLYAVPWIVRGRKTDPQPPGPKPDFLVGHTFQVPVRKHWKYYDGLLRKYGQIVKLSMAGDDILVLGSSVDAEELLGRRSAIYSSRRPLIYSGKYQSNNKRLLLLPYGAKLRQQRTAFLSMVHPRLVSGYQPMQYTESIQLVYDILVSPHTSITRHCQQFAASLVFYLAYGKRLGSDGKDLTALVNVFEGLIEDTFPGAHLVDTFPVLDLLPDALAPWRIEARKKHDYESALYTRLAAEVRKEILNGNTNMECFAARLWEQQKEMKLEEEDIAYIAGSAFEAGTDTTSGVLLWFILAMILYPDVMKKAHQELDTVLGKDGANIPTFEHFDNLPYCTALCKEAFRWIPIAPAGFPHFSDADDIYKGYKIKMGTVVIPCLWTMHHDEAVYKDPFRFDPDRYLTNGVLCDNDLTRGHYAFGFGRRKCPGLHLASKSVWIAIVRMLWAFNIELDYDAQRMGIQVLTENCTLGQTSRPQEFPNRITPRSSFHAETILKEWRRFNSV